MHTRKLQQIGGGTLYLSLPKDLVRRWNLKKGDVIKIEETADGNIILYVKEEGMETEESYGIINLTSLDIKSLQRKILGMYLLGYSTIIIKSFNEINSDIRDFIRKTCRDFIGLEIMEETMNSIVLQSVINISNLHPYKLLQRASLIANSIYKDALSSIVSGNVAIERSIARRDEDVNRLYFLIVRVLRTAARNHKILRKFEISDIDLMEYTIKSIKNQTIVRIALNLRRIGLSIIDIADLVL